MSFRYQRKRRRDDQNTDDWLITYADMITLLLCFFAIFLSVSIPRDEDFQKARARVMEQFAPSETPKEGQAPERETSDVLPDSMEQSPEHDAIQGGDRITIIEMNSAAFFETGSADLNGTGKQILSDLLPSLKSRDFSDYRITIEGHTDDTPIATTQFPSNWELSAARAAAVVRYLISQGIPAEKFRAAGYADTLPKVPNRDAAGTPIPDNRAQNRRVVIKLEKIEN